MISNEDLLFISALLMEREKTICKNGNGSGLFIIKRTQKNNLFEKEEFGQWTKDLKSLYKPTKIIKRWIFFFGKCNGNGMFISVDFVNAMEFFLSVNFGKCNGMFISVIFGNAMECLSL